MKYPRVTHASRPRPTAKRQAGFTLVELMIVVVIASILLGIAVPAYQRYSMKARRTEARTALLDLAAREERYFSTNNTYTQTAAQLGYSGAFPQNVGSGYYSVSIGPGAAPLTIGNSYVITATAVAPQTGDTSCITFTVDQTGLQSSADAGGANTAGTCWQ
ncbi:MAG: type IV pilin protein [Proteobacteria bacterium]|nr:type IV pilin protein [Pseudomonadota bacterium]